MDLGDDDIASEDELKAEMESRRMAFVQGYGLALYPPLSAKKLGRLLQSEVTDMRVALLLARQDLHALQGEKAAVKQWLKQVRREREEEDFSGGGFYV